MTRNWQFIALIVHAKICSLAGLYLVFALSQCYFSARFVNHLAVISMILKSTLYLSKFVTFSKGYAIADSFGWLALRNLHW